MPPIIEDAKGDFPFPSGDALSGHNLIPPGVAIYSTDSIFDESELIKAGMASIKGENELLDIL